MSAQVRRMVLRRGASPVARVAVSTPEGPGQHGQFSALERCRTHAANAQASREAAQSSQVQAQAASANAQTLLEQSLSVAGGVRVSPADTAPKVLSLALAAQAPLAAAVMDPGGPERLELSLAAMTGATAGEAGTAGAVPAPQAGDQGRFLGGDGLWHALDRASLGLSRVEDAWTPLPGPVAVLSATLAALPGDCLALAAPGRAIRPQAPAGAAGHVLDAAYDQAQNRTVVAVEGFSLAADCGMLEVGQDPANAPAGSSGAGDALYLANNYYYFGF